MAYVVYQASRALVPAHIVGVDYELALTISDLIRPSGGDLKEMPQAIAGNVETLFFGEVRTWSVTLAPVRISEAAIYYEFLRSTADGQEFTFDPYGSVGHNIAVMQVVRADDGYTEASFQREGRNGSTDWVTLGFQVREA
jgi:hypothetical protein